MTFSQDITRFVVKTGLSATVVFRKVGLDGYVGVTRRSPVDTGRFRANWRIGIDLADTSTTDVFDRVEGGAPATSAELSQAQAKLAEARFGQTIFISNNLPYGPRLEDGYSKQAPNGMVSLTLAELRDNLARAVEALEAA